jgi:hypothetical protein
MLSSLTLSIISFCQCVTMAQTFNLLFGVKSYQVHRAIAPAGEDMFIMIHALKQHS